MIPRHSRRMSHQMNVGMHGSLENARDGSVADSDDRCGETALRASDSARAIVEAHEGTVGFEAEPGQPTRFWVRLPASTRQETQ